MSLKNKYNVHNEPVCWSGVGAQWSYFPTKFCRSTREQSAFGSFPTGRERWPQPTMVSAAGKKSLLNKEKQRESNRGDVGVSGPAVDFWACSEPLLTRFGPGGHFSSADGEEVGGKLWSEKTQKKFQERENYRWSHICLVINMQNE